jgi:hypothetical protein
MRFHRSFSAAAAVALVGTLAVQEARADVNVPSAAGTAKGVTGGALLGAEVVLLTEAALDVEPTWAYIVGGVAGAAAGGVAGYFIEREVSAKTSMLMLAGGMLLIIPTAVAVLSATAYEVPADYVEDRGPTDVPVADPPAPDAPAPQAPDTAGQPTGSRRVRSKLQHARLEPKLYAPITPPALLALDEGLLSLRVPAVEVRDVYTTDDLRQYGMTQETEVKIPVLSYSF